MADPICVDISRSGLDSTNSTGCHHDNVDLVRSKLYKRDLAYIHPLRILFNPITPAMWKPTVNFLVLHCSYSLSAMELPFVFVLTR
jgi:hypothetical protein